AGADDRLQWLDCRRDDELEAPGRKPPNTLRAVAYGHLSRRGRRSGRRCVAQLPRIPGRSPAPLRNPRSATTERPAGHPLLPGGPVLPSLLPGPARGADTRIGRQPAAAGGAV